MSTHRIATSICGGLIFLFATTAWAAPGAPLSGRLISYDAGGMLRLSINGSERTVRLFGIAGLEPGQPFAIEAKTFVQEWAMDHTLTIEVVGEDAEGLPVAWVRRSPDESLNTAILEGGYAWWDQPNTPEARIFKRLTAQALVERKGLWNAPAPLAPWDYRAQRSLPPVRYKKPESETPPAPKAAVPTVEATGKGQPKPGPGAGLNQGPPPVFLGGSGPLPAQYGDLISKHQPQIARDSAGKALGLTATDITNIPGAAALGFQNGDIVQSVNGIAITNELQLLGLVGQFQGAKRLDLVVIRGGQPVKIGIPLR